MWTPALGRDKSVKSMKYDFLKNNSNTFYEVKNSGIQLLEKELGIQIPADLLDFWKNIGYGFIASDNNANRIMDHISTIDFRLRQGDFEYMPDIELYDEYETGKLIFFEANESAYISIGYSEENMGKIFYYDTEIASSLTDFLGKIQINHYCPR